MKRTSVVSPGKRVKPITIRPSAYTATTPLSDFIVPPSDPRGRSSPIHVGVSPAYTRMADIVLHCEKLPFKTPQDVYRFCIHHGLSLLMKIADDDEMKTEWNQLMSWSQAVAVETEQAEFAGHLQKTGEAILRLLEEGHKERALHLAETVWMQSDRIETPYWRKKYRTMAKSLLDKIRRKAKSIGSIRLVRGGGVDDDEADD